MHGRMPFNSNQSENISIRVSNQARLPHKVYGICSVTARLDTIHDINATSRVANPNITLKAHRNECG